MPRDPIGEEWSTGLDAIRYLESGHGGVNSLKHDTPVGPYQIRPSVAAVWGYTSNDLEDPDIARDVAQRILTKSRFELARDLNPSNPAVGWTEAEPYAIAAYNIGDTAVREGLGIRRDSKGAVTRSTPSDTALRKLQDGMRYWAKTQAIQAGIPAKEWRKYDNGGRVSALDVISNELPKWWRDTQQKDLRDTLSMIIPTTPEDIAATAAFGPFGGLTRKAGLAALGAMYSPELEAGTLDMLRKMYAYGFAPDRIKAIKEGALDARQPLEDFMQRRFPKETRELDSAYEETSDGNIIPKKAAGGSVRSIDDELEAFLLNPTGE